MKQEDIKYPIFLRASKFTLCPVKKNFLYSCAEGHFPYGIKYVPHIIKFDDKILELSNEPPRLCIQMLNILNKISEEHSRKNINRSVFEFSVKMQQTHNFSEIKRKELYSLVMMGIILKTINKNNIKYKGISITEIEPLIIDGEYFRLDLDNYQAGSSIKSK